jgi:hypothetical protein
MVTDAGPQNMPLDTAVGAAGGANTSKVIVFAHPLLLVNVILVLPVAMPLMYLVVDAEFVSEAMLLFAVNQGAFALNAALVPLPVSKEESPTHTPATPLIVGNALIVTAVSLKQPKVLVYLMVSIPPLTPVTKPLPLTVALGLEADQVAD